MSKLAEAIAANADVSRARCGVARTLEALSEDDAADLRAAIADPAITGAAIERGLAALGHRLPQLGIQRHRRGLCLCR